MNISKIFLGINLILIPILLIAAIYCIIEQRYDVSFTIIVLNIISLSFLSVVWKTMIDNER